MKRAKRAAAWTIYGAAWAGTTVAIGATVRGPFAGGGMWRDAVVGAGIVGAALALRWAHGELAAES